MLYVALIDGYLRYNTLLKMRKYRQVFISHPHQPPVIYNKTATTLTNENNQK